MLTSRRPCERFEPGRERIGIFRDRKRRRTETITSYASEGAFVEQAEGHNMAQNGFSRASVALLVLPHQ
jgi:hypothetical protein